MLQNILAATERLMVELARPVVIALDGPSGSGKTTVANQLVALLPAVVIPSDDFFAAEITAAEWDARSAAERAGDGIDWRRIRRFALEPLRVGRSASWHPFDFAAGERDDGTYPMSEELVHRAPAPVIILDGAYSARPELADLIDLAVLVDVPFAIRQARLTAREPPAFLKAWHRRWDAAEAFYFSTVCPPSRFDFVIDTAADIVRQAKDPSRG